MNLPLGVLSAAFVWVFLVQVPIEGMICTACVAGISGAVRRLDGVESVRVGLASETATVGFDTGRVSPRSRPRSASRATSPASRRPSRWRRPSEAHGRAVPEARRAIVSHRLRHACGSSSGATAARVGTSGRSRRSALAEKAVVGILGGSMLGHRKEPAESQQSRAHRRLMEGSGWRATPVLDRRGRRWPWLRPPDMG